MISCTCPRCKSLFQIDDAQAGSKFNCPCGQRLEVPFPPSKTVLAPLVPPSVIPVATPLAPSQPEVSAETNRTKIIAGCLAVTLGWLGVHKYFLREIWSGNVMAGWTTIGILTDFFFLPIVVGAVGVAEGVLYLTRTDAEFHTTYLANRRSWF